jgi:hypothetical protein
MMTETFWIPEGNEVFRATIHTQGPWNPQFQHGGPPAALLVRQLEACSPREDMVLARVSIDILTPVPIATVTARAHVLRPGRSVELLEAELEHEGRTVMRANGWRVRQPNVRPPSDEPDLPPALPEDRANPTIASLADCGFMSATEWRTVRENNEQGQAIAWARLRYPLIAGETISPTQHLIAIADYANGLSWRLDIRSWQFVPPELTLHILRPPIGEWICLDAVTHLQSEGVGLTTANLFDQQGQVARSAQSLFITRRA